MGNKRSMKLPVIVAIIFLGIVVYLFTSIKQTEVVCEKTNEFSDIKLIEKVVSVLDGKKITSLNVEKTIYLPEKYKDDDDVIFKINEALHRTLDYLGDKVNYSYVDNKITIKISVKKNEVVLLDNISFSIEPFEIIVHSNTKSSDVLALTVGDNYTDGEFMQRLKKSGYWCK